MAKNFTETETKILRDREYILGLLKNVKMNDLQEFTAAGATVAKLLEVLCRQNQQLLDLEKVRIATKGNNNDSVVDEDLKDLANSVPVQFDQKMPS